LLNAARLTSKSRPLFEAEGRISRKGKKRLKIFLYLFPLCKYNISKGAIEMFKTAVYIIIVAAFLFGYVRYTERRITFFPMKRVEFTPEVAGLSFEDIYFAARDNARINAWFIPADQARYTILFCHGNAGNIGHRLEKITMLHRIGLNVFIIDYRGYGQSRGRPSERGLYLDAKAGYDYLLNHRRLSPEQIILYGESLGSAAVIDLASKEKVAGLILEGTFTRGRDMAKRICPFLPAFLFSDSFNSLDKIKQVNAPKLFIHSKNDEIVPFAFCRKLYDTADKPKYLAELIGGHNSAFVDSREKYISSIASFAGRLARE